LAIKKYKDFFRQGKALEPWMLRTLYAERRGGPDPGRAETACRPSDYGDKKAPDIFQGRAAGTGGRPRISNHLEA
jgi:hypothetical protein